MTDAPAPAAPPVPTTYRERLAQFKILEEKRIELIEELLDKLEKTETKLAQTELDLNSEQNVRRTLQAEVVEAKEREDAMSQRQARRPFALVLIDADADGFLFQDKYLTRKAQGGEALADELLVRTKEYLRPQFEDADNLDILVRVYANLEGMANYLASAGGYQALISSIQELERKAAQDVSSENLSFYTSSVHLRHVIVACSPTDLPASLLSKLPLDKVTLVESVPLPASLTSLPLQVTKLATLFPPPPAPKSPRPRGRGPQLQLMQQEDPDGGATWLVINPDRNTERSKSQGAALRRRNQSEDDHSSLSISIGPDNTVSVDNGRRRRIMG